MLVYALRRHLGHTDAPLDVDLNALTSEELSLPDLRWTHDHSSVLNEAGDLRDPFRSLFLLDKSSFKNHSVILLVRDPRDVVVSHYHQLTKRSDQPMSWPDLDTFVRDEVYGFDRILNFMNNWASQRAQPSQFLLVRYEELSLNTSETLRKVLQFCDLNVSSEIIKATVAIAQADNMRELEKSGSISGLRLFGSDPNALKVRKARIGNWREELSPETQAYCRTRLASLHPIFRYTPEAITAWDQACQKENLMATLSETKTFLCAEFTRSIDSLKSEHEASETRLREEIARHAARTKTAVRRLDELSRELQTLHAKLESEKSARIFLSKQLKKTFKDASRRIHRIADSWFSFPIRGRLRRFADTLGTGSDLVSKTNASSPAPHDNLPPTTAIAPPPAQPHQPPPRDPSGDSPQRFSNPYHDLRTPEARKALKSTPKEQLSERNRITREFRRRYFQSSPEYSAVKQLAGRHAGKRCFILGNGPSLATQDLSFLKNEITFVSNWFVNAERYGDISPKYYCVSSHEMFGGWNKPEPLLNEDFYRAMQEKAKEATKVFSFAFRDYIRESGLFAGEELYYLLFERPKQLVDQIGSINLDLSDHLDDGYTVIQSMCVPLAVHLGCTEIILLGCDCDYGIQKADDPKRYFYDSSLHKTSTTKFESLNRIWADDGPVFKSYEILNRCLSARGVRLVNATRGGRLDVLERVNYESLFNQ